ncbi:MAG TPA: hypothetical protein PK497_14735 [Burkholderiaceae bacterium]|jgi:hypothetical protein|nr:hypothetical protein [Burkholderiaceae bacterium]HPH12164.1 hypothetical protein [Burkholderiaceae bacterium]
MDNNTTIPSMLGPVNTIPSGLGPVSSSHVKPKPQDGVTLPRIALWLILGVAVVFAVRHFTR